MNSKASILFLIIICAFKTYSQYDDRNFSISLNAVFTTNAKIYLTPFSSDPILRNNAFPLSDILNPSLELRYRLSEPLIIGLNVEYMRTVESGPGLTVFEGSSTRTIIVEDGFLFIPLELSLLYILPFSSESFKFIMGGGAGYYIGDHIRKVGDVTVSNEERRTAYGIHVSAGLGYQIIKDGFINFQMKFRDPQFTVKSRYSSRTINYQGRTVRLAQDTFDSKVNINGITFMLGISYQF
jgi:hypothetical protein